VAKRKQLTKKFFKETGSQGGVKVWAGMTPEERSAEMKRRAKVRAKNQAAQAKGRPGKK
jgi:hypothetical protein